jgi:hypothetical protein
LFSGKDDALLNPEDYIVFKVTDKLLLPTLQHYQRQCEDAFCDIRQTRAVTVLILRVVARQQALCDRMKLPDVEPGELSWERVGVAKSDPTCTWVARARGGERPTLYWTSGGAWTAELPQAVKVYCARSAAAALLNVGVERLLEGYQWLEFLAVEDRAVLTTTILEAQPHVSF